MYNTIAMRDEWATGDYWTKESGYQLFNAFTWYTTELISLLPLVPYFLSNTLALFYTMFNEENIVANEIRATNFKLYSLQL